MHASNEEVLNSVPSDLPGLKGNGEANEEDIEVMYSKRKWDSLRIFSEIFRTKWSEITIPLLFGIQQGQKPSDNQLAPPVA